MCCSGNGGDARSSPTRSVVDVIRFFLNTGMLVPSCLRWIVWVQGTMVCLYYLFQFSMLRSEVVTQLSGWCPYLLPTERLSLMKSLISSFNGPVKPNSFTVDHLLEIERTLCETLQVNLE